MAGARIREARGKKLTQEELAKATGLSRVSVVNIEAGRQKLLLHHVFRIAEALGLSVSDLIAPLETVKISSRDFSSADDLAPFVTTGFNKISNQYPKP
ncbi:MAG: helix-turn-helix transcriptional regulator [Verrucomicrobiae bacterium]|nr:helix-turn-helix transcriptional regulator [Verrucomicrobiae bacterium]